MARKTKTRSKKKPVAARTRKAAKAKPKTARATRGGAARKAVKKTSARPERMKMRQKKHLSKSRGHSKSIASARGHEEKAGQSVASRNYEASGQWDDDWATEPKTESRTDTEIQER
jgi:hypothetical protein